MSPPDRDQAGEQPDAGPSSVGPQSARGHPSTSGQSSTKMIPSQQRSTSNIRPTYPQPYGSHASRASAAPSTSNTHTSYASFPSEQSARAPSTRQPQNIQPAPSAIPQDIRGYQNITSVEPAPKRPLWSLGSTLPRLRRLPAKPTRTAHPTPGSRSNIVQQPPTLRSTQPTAPRTKDPEVDDEHEVHRHDYADTTGNESDDAQGIVRSNTNEGGSSLQPIQEGAPLRDIASNGTSSGPANVQARPLIEHSFSSPTALDTANIRVVGEDILKQAAARQPGQSSRSAGKDTRPNDRLSKARQQLAEEAKHGTGLLAIQGSAVDATDHESEEDKASIDGVTSHPVEKRLRTSSTPFLPSQGFDVLVAEPSHKGVKELHTEVMGKKRSRADSHRSAMDQTRHPGLSGARPTPKGRAAGGPAAGVGVRKPSTQSHRRSSNATEDEGHQGSYFDEDMPLHELTHLERSGSRPQHGSRRSHRGESGVGADEIEARPVGGRSTSHRSSGGRDTRSAWLKHSMPSHAKRQKDEGERLSRDDEGEKGTSIEQGRNQKGRKGLGANEGRARHSEETVFSSFSTDREDQAVSEGYGNQTDEDGNEGAEEEHKGYVGEDDVLWLGGQGEFSDGTIAFPTTWARWRYHSREFLAELLATMLLITVGTAVDCQVTLSQTMGPNAGAYSNQNWAWGIAVASTIYLSGGRSGAHCNPAITLALAVFRGFPWFQVPIYFLAQLLGSLLGAAITYGIYLPAISAFEGGPHIRTLTGPHGTGRLFVTVPQLVFTPGSGFGTEVVATSILMAMVLAVGDETNSPPSDGLSALVLGLVVVMIGMSFGWPTSYAISPSRDLGPRLFLWMVGYGKELWTHNEYWWIYGPQVGCFTGGLLGALLYDAAIFTGEESPINYTREGWKQSTPSRLIRAVERVRVWVKPKRDEKGGARNEGLGNGELGNNDKADAISMSRVGRGSGMESQLSNGGDGYRRRQSHASQQLDAQELGRSQSASAEVA